MSDFALVHSNEGTFTYTPKGHHISKLLSGGHGQAGMDLLDKLGIQYNIVKTYQNGVRIGNIPAHKDKLKRSGTGQSAEKNGRRQRDGHFQRRDLQLSGSAGRIFAGREF